MWSGNYSLSPYWIPDNFAKNRPLFHSHSMNIRQIANRKAGGERAARTGHCTYWSCHDTIRTQILNCRQRCRNRKVGTAVQFQPGRKTIGLCPVQVTHPPRQCRSGFRPGNDLNRAELPAKNRTTCGLPGPGANTINVCSQVYFELHSIAHSRPPWLSLSIALDGTLPTCLTNPLKYSLKTLPTTVYVCSQVHSQLHSMTHSQPTWQYTSK